MRNTPIAALNTGKHVMVETPLSLSIPSAKRILDAEKNVPNGAKVFVASARRYAPCFTDVFKNEVASLERICYARLRMIIALFHYNGSTFRSASSNFQPPHHDHGPRHGFYPFTLLYEAGTDSVPRCDAQMAIYGLENTVTMHYDLPYARGYPARVVVGTADERGGLMQTETVSTWEEAYRVELEALYGFLVRGESVPTTGRDGVADVRPFQSVFEQYDRQCGTIRTPFGLFLFLGLCGMVGITCIGR
ncbi:uncharacterized protein BDV14DRAFT_194553 [Aspergillus stella-maris]|uniref:uncharacterized protein n=1 Tax=Aspergillus stella-maris TaxID=1810926 RepID=UPI003CCCA428